MGGITQGAEQDSGQTFERESLNIPYSLPDGRSLREYLNEQYRGEPITWTNATTGKRIQMVQTENGAPSCRRTQKSLRRLCPER